MFNNDQNNRKISNDAGTVSIFKSKTKQNKKRIHKVL